MCGLAGLLDSALQQSDQTLRDTAAAMAARLRHRGPDDHGVWADAAAGIALGHRRLCIIDPSPSGHQPMISRSGRFVLVYNGEVYNHPELRAELESGGVGFRGHCDTEVLVEAVEAWGLVDTVRRANGMFAFALWDRQRQQLTLARDRLGIKPLYYGWCGRTFMFASELKALRAHPQFHGQIDRGALSLLLLHNYIPAPHSIYRGIYKLPPGTWLTISRASHPSAGSPEKYWCLKQVAEAGRDQPFAGTDGEAVEQLEQLLSDSVRLQMRADVPWGAFLSGGVDSSAVVSLMQAQTARPVKTFCIGFEEPAYNEAEYARALAEHLRTDHTTLVVSAAEARDVIPQLPTLFDEPLADSSQIPTFLVAQLTRRQVTVSLSGDGGDELFGGYDRYAVAERLWESMRWLAPRLRRRLAQLLQPWPRWGAIGRKIGTAAELLDAPDARRLYTRLHTHWKQPQQIVAGGHLPLTPFDDTDQWADRGNLLETMMYADTITYLPEDILAKVDRASMGVSLEARVPLLDHRVVEFAWRLPASFKVRGGQSKWILRQLLDRYVPRSLVERPKVGFGVPLDAWLRGPLRDWAESLLDQRRLLQEGFFKAAPIRRKWREHLAGQQDWHYHLWDILIFQAWLEHERQ